MSKRRSSVAVCAAAVAGVCMIFPTAPAFAASASTSSEPASAATTGSTSAGVGSASSAAPNAIAFAHISSNGSVASFGGTKTKSASVSRVATGDYRITFNGSYGDVTLINVIPVSTAESGTFAVSNAVVDSANKKQIVIDVFTFDPESETNENNDCFVVVFHGN